MSTISSRTDPEFVMTDAPDGAIRDGLYNALIAFNQERAGRLANVRPLAVLIKDRRTGEVMGGLWGRTAWTWLFVELLFIPESLRGSGIGTDLVRQAEEEAVRRGCRGAWLDTYSFQARGFYERLGYAVFGTIEDYPPGHSRYFLQKALSPAAG